MLTPFKGQWRNFDSERLLNGVERVRTIYFGGEILSITWIRRQDLFLVISIYERQMLDISFSLGSFSKFFLLRCSVNHSLLCKDIYSGPKEIRKFLQTLLNCRSDLLFVVFWSERGDRTWPHQTLSILLLQSPAQLRAKLNKSPELWTGGYFLHKVCLGCGSRVKAEILISIIITRSTSRNIGL